MEIKYLTNSLTFSDKWTFKWSRNLTQGDNLVLQTGQFHTPEVFLVAFAAITGLTAAGSGFWGASFKVAVEGSKTIGCASDVSSWLVSTVVVGLVSSAMLSDLISRLVRSPTDSMGAVVIRNKCWWFSWHMDRKECQTLHLL